MTRSGERGLHPRHSCCGDEADGWLHASILSAGHGRRMGAAIASKALIPYLGRPLIRTQLDILRGWGVRSASLLTRPISDQRSLYIAVDDAAIPCEVVPVDEWPGVFAWMDAWAVQRRGTMLMINSDLILDDNWNSCVLAHLEAGADLTVAAAPAPRGDGQYGKPGDFRIAGSDESAVVYQIGMSLSSPRALRQLRALQRLTSDPWVHEFIPRLKDRGFRVQAALSSGYWRDLGTWHRVWAAHADQQPRYVDQNATVDRQAILTGWYWIGAGAVVEAGALVTDSVIAAGAHVGSNAHVHRSFVGERSRLEPSATLRMQVLHSNRAPESMSEALGT